MSGRVVHFEIPFDDGDRARRFYGEAFGWQVVQVPGMAPNLVIDVDGIDDALRQVTESGGAVVSERMAVGDMGFAAYFTDTEGNLVGLWETRRA